MAGVVSGFVQDVAWLMKNAARRSDVPVLSWATVVNGSPSVTVMLDGTTTARQVSGNAVGRLEPGQRVRVEVQGTRVVTLAAPDVDTGWISVPVHAGFTTTDLRVRRVGTLAMASGSVVRSDGGLTTTASAEFATLPPEFWPVAFRRYPSGGAATTSSLAQASITLNTAGSWYVHRSGGPSGATSSRFYCDHMWFTD